MLTKINTKYLRSVPNTPPIINSWLRHCL